MLSALKIYTSSAAWVLLSPIYLGALITSVFVQGRPLLMLSPDKDIHILRVILVSAA